MRQTELSAERLQEAAQAVVPLIMTHCVPPPAVHQPIFVRLQLEEDFVDMGCRRVNWSERNSVQFRKKKHHRLEFIMAVVLCTEEIAAIAPKGMLRSSNEERGCDKVVGHAMLLHQIATDNAAKQAAKDAAAVREALILTLTLTLTLALTLTLTL